MSLKAEQLFNEHGQRTLQLLVDQIAIAVRAGDDAAVNKLDATMREVERLLECRNPDEESQRRQSTG